MGVKVWEKLPFPEPLGDVVAVCVPVMLGLALLDAMLGLPMPLPVRDAVEIGVRVPVTLLVVLWVSLREGVEEPVVEWDREGDPLVVNVCVRLCDKVGTPLCVTVEVVEELRVSPIETVG